jgi:uncharacterized protein
MPLRIKKSSLYLSLITLLALLSVLFLLYSYRVSIMSLSSDQKTFLGLVATGLFAGSFSCLATQGGLFATLFAQHELGSKQRNATQMLPFVSFFFTRILSYTIVGFLLGWLGAVVQISLPFRIALMVILAIFMVGTALSILSPHPVFRFFILQPPLFIKRVIKKQSNKDTFFAPVFLGGLSVFIPCGMTQAMMALAVISGSGVAGAITLFAFVLGSTPLFLLVAYMLVKLSTYFQKMIFKGAAYIIIFFALITLNNALALSGAPTVDRIFSTLYCLFHICDTEGKNPVSKAVILMEQHGYSPNVLTVQAGSTVTLQLSNKSGYGCTQSFVIPALGIEQVIPVGNTKEVTFTAPEQKGTLSFMCSAGAYRGEIHVI